jgi:hypothetical protein
MTTVNEARKALNEGVKFLNDVFPNTNFNYTPLSLMELDVDLRKQFPFPQKPMPTTAIALGFYLGEVIVKNVDGAEFIDEEITDEGIWDIKVKVPVKFNGELTDFEVKPVVRIVNTLNNRNQEIYGWYKMIEDFRTGKIDISEQQKQLGKKQIGDWQVSPSGAIYRLRKNDDM